MTGTIVRCSACGQANRIPPDSAGKKIVCGRCRSPLALADSGRPVVLTDATFSSLVDGAKPVVVDFWASWCGPCRQIAPVIESMAASRQDVLFAKLNVDENPATQSRFRVSGIPTLIFFQKGEEKGRIVGAVEKPQIEQAIRRYLAP